MENILSCDGFVFPQGTFCDLITGEERKLVSPDGNPANHIACTVEMTNVAQPCETLEL